MIFVVTVPVAILLPCAMCQEQPVANCGNVTVLLSAMVYTAYDERIALRPENPSCPISTDPIELREYPLEKALPVGTILTLIDLQTRLEFGAPPVTIQATDNGQYFMCVGPAGDGSFHCGYFSDMQKLLLGQQAARESALSNQELQPPPTDPCYSYSTAEDIAACLQIQINLGTTPSPQEV